MQFDFLLCSERSGSNLITRLINAHSQICGPATTHLFRLLCQNAAGYGDLRIESHWQALIHDTLDLLRTTLGLWKTGWCPDSLSTAVRNRSLAELLRVIYETECAAHDKQQLFVKEIEVHSFRDFLEEDFPSARYLYVVRDPRDMALSWKRSTAIRGGVMRAAQVWSRDQRALWNWVRDQDDATAHRLTYEQLVTNTSLAMQGVFRFLGVPFERSHDTFHSRHDTVEMARSAKDFANLENPIMPENVGKFRAGLSSDEVQYVETVCQDLMPRFGYEFSIGPHVQLDFLAKQLEPLEQHTKPAYQSATTHEKETRAAWTAVTDRIRNRESRPRSATVAEFSETKNDSELNRWLASESAIAREEN